MPKKLTPAQQQYIDLKQEHKDALLFFRLGDFYELFYEDAKLAHQELDITLTARHKNSANPIPMAWVPYHSVEKYIKKLIQAGYKVAIADQVGKVVPGKVVERKIVRVITPGTAIKDEEVFNHIAALYYGGTGKELYHLAWGDVSLGTFSTQSFNTLEEMLNTLSTIDPGEIIVDIHFPERESLKQYIQEVLSCPLSFDDVPYDTIQYLRTITGTSSLVWYGKALQSWREHALALLFSYTSNMQKQALRMVHSIRYVLPDEYISLDETTIRNLEIFSSRAEASSKQSLYGVINTCQTAMWSRLLQEQLLYPLRDETLLQDRLSAIEYYVQRSEERQHIMTILHGIVDLPRLVSKIVYRKAQATKIQQLMVNLAQMLQHKKSDIFHQALLERGLEGKDFACVSAFLESLQEAFEEGQINDEMRYIRDGYDTEVDKYRQIAYHSDDLLLKYQQDIIDYVWGIKVKVKYIKNQWYCLELTPKDVELFESTSIADDKKFDFFRRQTLKTGQRYTTTYLQSLEWKILEAKTLLQKREEEILDSFVERLKEQISPFLSFFEAWAKLDLASSFAHFSQQHAWSKPSFVPWSVLAVQEGRHPVVEHFLETTQEFIPNNCLLDEKRFFHLITGPNMWGKSTFLRQNALIVLLAHAWLYVPAASAEMSLVDGIFARVGSGDALAKNQSTFMTEMLEMAHILHNATEKSFVILDELGRGTSTYDGLALARAISVFLCQEIKAKTLFATHYHELTDLEDTLDGCANFSVSVYETDQEVVFLKKVVKGKASKSYGIDVAKLAGIAPVILQQAEEYLAHLEKAHIGSRKAPLQKGFDFGVINDVYKQKYQAIEALLDDISLDDITPIEALVLLQKVKKIVLGNQ